MHTVYTHTHTQTIKHAHFLDTRSISMLKSWGAHGTNALAKKNIFHWKIVFPYGDLSLFSILTMFIIYVISNPVSYSVLHWSEREKKDAFIAEIKILLIMLLRYHLSRVYVNKSKSRFSFLLRWITSNYQLFFYQLRNRDSKNLYFLNISFINIR